MKRMSIATRLTLAILCCFCLTTICDRTNILASAGKKAILDNSSIDWMPTSGRNHNRKAIASRSVSPMDLPLYFVENRGQAHEKAKYVATVQGRIVLFTKDGVLWQSQNPNHPNDSNESPALRISFVQPGKDFELVGENPQQCKFNYFRGNDPDTWLKNVPAYRSVVYRGAYSGIDLKFYGVNQQIEYDVIVEPGADLSQVRLRYDGIDTIKREKNGDCILILQDGQRIVQKKPLIYHVKDDERTKIDGDVKFIPFHCEVEPNSISEVGAALPALESARIKNKSVVITFQVDPYDNGNRLVIDPVLSYSTFLDDESEYGYSTKIVSDSLSNVYAIVSTGSDFYLAKINSSGDELIYKNYIGGTAEDYADDIALDCSGNVCISGFTRSSDFPTVNPIFNTYSGNCDTFVLKVNSTGDQIIYSTYLGGNSYDGDARIAIDSNENIYITGMTSSSDFPVKDPIFPFPEAGEFSPTALFVTKINSSGSALVYSTFLGTGMEMEPVLAVDNEGSACITGTTFSSDYPTKNPIFPSLLGEGDAFVTKLNPSGSALVYSTFLGGSEGESSNAIAVDRDGAVYITGSTDSMDFPILNAAFPSMNGNADVFLAKIAPSGAALEYSTYFGGTGLDAVYGLAVDHVGNTYIVGHTNSTDLPMENAIFPTYFGGYYDGFIAKFDSDGSDLIFSTYIGGSIDGRGHDSWDYPWCIIIDNSGDIIVSGDTSSIDFPTKDGLFPVHTGESYDAFIAKFKFESCPLILSFPNGGENLETGKSHMIEWACGDADTVDIFLYHEDCEVLQIAASAPNTGSFDFFVPDCLKDSNLYRVKIVAGDGSSEDFSDSPFSIQAPSITWIPVYRYYLDNSPYHEHLYTTFEPEVTNPWNSEGVEFYVSKEEFSGSVPVYRLRMDGEKRLRLLTSSDIEKEQAIAAGYVYEQLLGYANPADTLDGTLIRRVFKEDTGDRLYTENYAEAEELVQSHGYVWEDDLGCFVQGYQPELAVFCDDFHIPNSGVYELPDAAEVGDSMDVAFSLTNQGNDVLNIGRVQVDSAEFSVIQQPAQTLSKGESSAFSIRFAPVSFGAKETNVSFSSNDPNENPFGFSIKAVGHIASPPEICLQNVERTIRISAFGETRSVEINNCGDEVLHWEVSASDDQWLHASPLNGSLDGGSSFMVSLDVDANDSSVDRSGNVTFSDSANPSNFRKIFFEQSGLPVVPEGDLDAVDVWTVETQPTAGAPCDLFVKIKNIGDGVSGETTVTFYLQTPFSKEPIFSQTVAALNSGAETIQGCIYTFQASGNYLLRAEIEPFAGESETGNNTVLNDVLVNPPEAEYRFRTGWDCNFGNVSTRSDHFHAWLKFYENDRLIKDNLVPGYHFEIRTGGPQGPQEAEFITSEHMGNGKHRVEFVIYAGPNPRAAYFENGKIYVYKTLEDGNRTGPYPLEEINSFSIYGTTFDMQKHSWKFRNKDWAIPKWWSLTKARDYYNAGDIIDNYISENGGYREAFWTSFGSINLDSFELIKESISPNGGCSGLVSSAISNFTHQGEQNSWGGGGVKEWDDEINERWDQVPESTIEPHKPFVTDIIYGDSETHDTHSLPQDPFELTIVPSVKAMKKIMYYHVAQSYFQRNQNQWVGMDARKDDLNHSFATELLINGAPIHLSIKFKNDNTLHSVAGTQLISWDGQDKLMIWDNEYPYPIADSKYSPYLEWFIPDKNNFPAKSKLRIEEKTSGNGKKIKYNLHQNVKYLPFGNKADGTNSDSQNIYNLWPSTKAPSGSVSFQAPEYRSQDNNVDYHLRDFCKILVVGAEIESVEDKDLQCDIQLIPNGELHNDQASFFRSPDGIFTELYLPTDALYKINAQKYADWPGIKIFVTIPYSDKTIEKINYENLAFEAEENIEFYLFVGRDNPDKTVYASVDQSPLGTPDFDSFFGHAVLAPEHLSATYDGNAVELNWNNPESISISEIVIVRNEEGYPESTEDGIEIFRGSGEQAVDTSAVSGKLYYYGAFIVDTSGNVSEPANLQLDTSLSGIGGTISESTGEMVEGAEFVLSDDLGNPVDVSRSDKYGHYSFSNLSNGNYSLNAYHFSFDIHNPVREIVVYSSNIQEDFTATPKPVISLVFDVPTVHISDTMSIQWSYRNIENDRNIDILINTGYGWEVIGENIPIVQGLYQWTVESPEAENASLRIVLSDDGTVYKEMDLYIDDAIPYTCFSASSVSGAAPIEVAFTDCTTSGDSIASWSWDFGDGTLSSEQNPTHAYVLPGTYTVSLTVTDSNQDSSTYTEDGYIEVEPSVAKPTAATEPADSETSTSARLHGNLNPNGADTTWYFEYWLNPDEKETTDEFEQPAGCSEIPVETTAYRLLPESEYTYRLVATNIEGTTYGEECSFDTIPIAGEILYLEPNGVCGNKIPCFFSITEAIENALEETTILVAGGTYTGPLVVDGNVTLEIGWDSNFLSTVQSECMVIVGGL